MTLPYRRKRDRFLPGFLIAADVLVIAAVLHGVFWLRFLSGFFPSVLSSQDYSFYLRSFVPITLVLILFLRHYGLYKPTRLLTFSTETLRVWKAVFSCTLILMALTFFFRGFSYSRTYLIAAGTALAVGVSSGRFLLGFLIMEVDRFRGSVRNVAIVGSGENARRLARFYKKHPRFNTCIVGYFNEGAGEGWSEVPWLGAPKDVPAYLPAHRELHELVLAVPGMSTEEVLRLIHHCEKEMITFRWIADIFGLLTSKMSVSYLGGVPLLSFTDSPLAEWENRALKRTVDIVLSGLALLILSPVFLVIAILVKLDSKGPVFYAQKRMGEDGRRFTLIKFRTMRPGAEKHTGPVWAVEGDPRRTKLGAFLRQSNCDELPQLWNVLRGDMSLVGPRPERPFFVRKFRQDIPRYMARHSIRSGITGWAQVNGLRGNTSVEERTQHDLYYIENWSLLLDLKIIFLTVLKLFSSKNAY